LLVIDCLDLFFRSSFKIAKKIKPKKVFEGYGGVGNQTFEWIKIANEVYVAEKYKTKIKYFKHNLKKNNFV
jgi:tRNA/tmRNA/rRNA uracil-C5-methylase (TrmA/RlmC/RlmD family)